MNQNILDIDDWFQPLTLDEFRTDVFGASPKSFGRRVDLAERLMGAFGVRTIEDVLALRVDNFWAWFHRRNGTHTTAQVSAKAARELHGAGLSVYVERATSFVPLERKIAEALDLPSSLVKCALLVNTAGGHTRAHFDTVDVVTVQLSGRKVWGVAPNQFAPSPLRNWATLDPVPSPFRLYTADAGPLKMPAGATTHELLPGSVLHLPRGYWHETISDEDSMSLHILITPPSPLDVILNALQNELSRDETMRRTDYGLLHGGQQAMARIPSMLERVQQAVSRLDPRDLVRLQGKPALTPHANRFVRRAQASLGLEAVDVERDEARITVFAYRFSETTRTTLEISAHLVPACRWINDRATGAEFEFDEVCRAVPGVARGDARELLAALEIANLLRACH